MFFSMRADASADDRSPWGDFWFQPVPYRGGTGAALTADAALQLSAVFACVRILAEGVACMPFKLFKLGPDGERTPVVDHWLYRLFGRRPNGYQNPFEFRELLQAHLALRGNAYCRIVESGAGEVTDLLPISPDRIKPEMIGENEWRYVLKRMDGTDERLTRQEVFHIRGLSTDGILGLNPIQAARQSIGLGLSAQAYGSRFFDNDAMPGGWIEYPGKFDNPEKRGLFREQWQAVQGGKNRGKTAVLEGGMKFHELAVTNEDAQFLETRKFQVTEIARLFRVPPHMVADLERATFSNIEQQSLNFVMHTLTPWLIRWEEAIEWAFIDAEADEQLDIEFPVTSLLRGDAEARSGYYNSGIVSGWLTRNEARAQEGLNPLEGLDKPLQPLNMTPEGQAQPGLQPKALPKPKPAPADDARAQALAATVAERVARKETAMVESRITDMVKLAEAYAAHADFVAAALGVPFGDALAYCHAQLKALAAWRGDVVTADFENLARCRLERLALTGKWSEQ